MSPYLRLTRTNTSQIGKGPLKYEQNRNKPFKNVNKTYIWTSGIEQTPQKYVKCH